MQRSDTRIGAVIPVIHTVARYCITPRAASMISIFADLPLPSSATTATMIGDTIRLGLWPQTSLTSRFVCLLTLIEPFAPMATT